MTYVPAHLRQLVIERAKEWKLGLEHRDFGTRMYQ